jgi:protein-S-isoprenylcysteine O-methyltransferase Ste14
MPWYVWDSILATQFVIVHSWLLLPTTRDRLERWIPSAFYGCLFCVATCSGLLLAIELWQREPAALLRLHGAAGWAARIAFLACWPTLIYSLSLTGLGFQTGLTPWLAWLRRQKPPRRVFQPRGAYRILRHPVYLSFLGLIWFAPVITLDRALLIAIWTVYIFFGSALKDRRLLHYIGKPYLEYQQRVPGYPFFLIGPLARVRPKEQQTAVSSWSKAA